MKSQRYAVKFTGETPLLMHGDNIPWTDAMKKWGSDPMNKRNSVAGDDRSPAWKWIGCLYIEGGKIVIPSDNIMSSIRSGAKRVPKGRGSYKETSQSNCVVDQSSWPLLICGNEVSSAPFTDLIENPDFSEHEKMTEKHGFMLFVKRAPIGQAKHVRVRPRFDNWSCQGTITINDTDAISGDIFKTILDQAGFYAGLGDWRPNSPKAPGPWGKYSVEIKEI